MKHNMDQLNKLTASLEAARDDLEQINLEETLLEWEPSAFPQLQMMFTQKEPYDKLWSNALSFTQKSEEWLNGKK